MAPSFFVSSSAKTFLSRFAKCKAAAGSARSRLRRTQRATVNFTWSPIRQADIVLEFLTGTRVNKDGQRGTSSQLQAGWSFRF
jgi:hypothetical protein